MSRITADQLIGRTIYARRRVPVFTRDFDGARPVRFIEPGQRIGVIDTWLSKKEGNAFWYWGLLDRPGSNAPYFFVPHDPSLLDLPRLKEDYEVHNEALRQQRMSFWERLAETGGQALAAGGNKVMTGIWLFGGIFLVSKLLK